ncbi:replication associated protein [Lake Sarah-associated circular molecule 3]|uniref:replication associated protein n=1 Tax=Lake Sarah-associated circular molecule 3 TaxID=1685728 RepID=UPI000777DFF7|nr:replication associated protein [Lake Sarah-associated circular molecule 3]ALE29539.1 replication associated protein [Lake Sarah-associated circular molecule 3]ALE29540.1 replication associated protein [Lake Sarah-associated circular molecule 3]
MYTNPNSYFDLTLPQRRFMFTSYTLEGEGFTVPDQDPRFRYCVYQAEKCPQTGNIHLQGYIEFKDQIRGNTVQKLMNVPGLHLSRVDYPEKARAYCMKLDTRYAEPQEYGKYKKEQGARNDLKAMGDMVLAGATHIQIYDAYPGQYIRYYKAIDRLRQIYALDKPNRLKIGRMECILFYGRPGTGKTTQAKEYAAHIKQAYWEIPIANSGTLWFDGYNAEPCVIIDDFSGKINLDAALRIFDQGEVQVPVKGGHVWWCPKTIIITSNVHPSNWYDYQNRQDSMIAMYRRLHRIVCFNRATPAEVDRFKFLDIPENAFDVIMETDQ